MFIYSFRQWLLSFVHRMATYLLSSCVAVVSSSRPFWHLLYVVCLKQKKRWLHSGRVQALGASLEHFSEKLISYTRWASVSVTGLSVLEVTAHESAGQELASGCLEVSAFVAKNTSNAPGLEKASSSTAVEDANVQ